MLTGLPQWRCHKVVGAFKIESIVANKDPAGTYGYSLYPELKVDEVCPIVKVGLAFFRARRPDNSGQLRIPDDYVGGYLVAYEDGYLSWSPAAAFEAGYTRID